MPVETDRRKERAQATRRRMVEAAYKLFSERGWGVPLTAIAAEAGVAVQTIYFTFHSKIELLQAALQLAVLGDDLPLAPHQRPWFHAMVDEPDARKSIAMIVYNTLPIFGRVAPLSGIFRSGDPEVVAMWAGSEKLRLDGYRILMEAVAKKGPMKVDLDEAVETIFVLMSPDLYWKAVSDRHWPPERWGRWLTDLLVGALID